MFHCGGLCLRRWIVFTVIKFSLRWWFESTVDILYLRWWFKSTVILFFKFCLSVRLLSVLRGHLVFSSPPQRSDFEGFLSQILSITCLSYLNSSERASISLLMLSAKQGHYWYHFITSLVWRNPWLRIESGTSYTQSQHYTTSLSRRR